jgi:hypothetical protein
VFLAGSGIRGNSMVGRTDDDLLSMPIDLATGESASDGDIPGCENVGVALLKLGGLDPEDHLPGIQSLDAILR